MQSAECRVPLKKQYCTSTYCISMYPSYVSDICKIESLFLSEYTKRNPAMEDSIGGKRKLEHAGGPPKKAAIAAAAHADASVREVRHHTLHRTPLA